MNVSLCRFPFLRIDLLTVLNHTLIYIVIVRKVLGKSFGLSILFHKAQVIFVLVLLYIETLTTIRMNRMLNSYFKVVIICEPIVKEILLILGVIQIFVSWTFIERTFRVTLKAKISTFLTNNALALDSMCFSLYSKIWVKLQNFTN